MANSVDPNQTPENVDLDNTNWKEWQIVKTLIRLLRMANSVDTDQTAEMSNSLDPDQIAENGE